MNDQRKTKKQPLGASLSKLLQDFFEHIESQGFTRSTRSGRIFYNANRPRIRIVITKTVIRIEATNLLSGRRFWHLVKSFYIARETTLAKQAIDGEPVSDWAAWEKEHAPEA